MEEERDKVSISRRTGYLAVVCAMMGTLMVGSYYSFSNMNPYIAAYLNSKGSQVDSKDTLLIMPIWLVNQSIFALVGVRLSERLGYNMVHRIAFTGFTIVNAIMIFVESYWVFIFVYGVLSGLTIGLGYLPGLYISWTYFPEHKSLVTGVVLFTSGISASILSPLATWVVNPEGEMDYSTDPKIFNRVPTLFKFLTVYFGVLTLISCTFQPKPYVSEEYQEKKQIEKEEQDYRKSFARSLLQSGKPSIAENRSSRRISISNRLLADMNQKSIRVFHTDELNKDLKGVIGEESAMIMANIETDKVVDLVQHRNNVDLLVKQERKSIRKSFKRKDIQDEKMEEFTNRIYESRRNTIYKQSVRLLKRECPSVSYGLRSVVYRKLALMAFGSSIVNYFLNSAWKEFYKTKFDAPDHQMALLLSIGSFSNSLSRLSSGALLLKVPFKAMFIGQASIALFICLTIDIFLDSYAVGAFYLILAYCGIGAQVTIFPTICTKVFGSVTGPKIYPFIYMCFSFANIVQYFVLQSFRNWNVMFYVFAGMAAISIAIGLTFDENPNWNGEDDDPEVYEPIHLGNVSGFSHRESMKSKTDK